MRIVSSYEVWRDIPLYPGYQASSEGRIRSLDRYKNGRLLKGRILRQTATETRGGKLYLKVYLGRGRNLWVHRVICSAFHGVPANKLEAAHIDDNGIHNQPDNLRWCTRKENERMKWERQ